jgi:hypothetical protein
LSEPKELRISSTAANNTRGIPASAAPTCTSDSNDLKHADNVPIQAQRGSQLPVKSNKLTL